ncbi:MAG: class I SAM-dependent methyltransferase [Deltaproteobacteria bacterium]|nr:class I SAM-dependent methyltransferase [Deltaproteobacteria bacterium]
MPRFDADGVREEWDYAADAYAKGQADGRDYYRLEFFGPYQIAMMGDVAGKKLLDVGCGSGYFSRAMAERGAHVTGVDISPRMIQHAQETGGAIKYEVLDAARIDTRFPAASFDVATACLALQDMPDPGRVLKAIAKVLVPGGRFVSAIEHPFSSMPFRQWHRGNDKKSKKWLCVDRYFDRGATPYTWKRWSYEFTTRALHVTLEQWIDWTTEAGFTIRALREPKPTDEVVRARPDLDDATRVPYFLIFDLTAPAAASAR